MERGTIVSWNVKEGDKVSAGQSLGDIETDKATMELQSFDSGTVAGLLIAEGQTVEVGTAILVIAEEGENPAEVKKSYSAGGASSSKKASAAEGSGKHAEAGAAAMAVAEPAESRSHAANGHSAAQSADGERSGGRIFASPLAKKVAAEMGVNLSDVTGTGPAGRITSKDVESVGSGGARSIAEAKPAASRAAAAPAMPPADSRLEKRRVALSNMRGVIAKRLVQSKTTIPHYQVTVVVNMDPLMTLREQLNSQLESQGIKLSVNDFLVRACALAMHGHPFINASWGADGQSIDLHERVNIGVAISLPIERGGGLVVATLRDADRVGLRQISEQTRTLAKKAREKGLSIEEMDGATFTISNLGMFGVEHFTAIINPPNSAILAVGGATQKPVVRDGQIVVGHEMQMTMSSDHRVIDGAMAAQYLASVKAMLEAPATLLV
jgi:pyruvate dehydrogenase E2 component (dihydrolipoamide acetyltransferase)